MAVMFAYLPSTPVPAVRSTRDTRGLPSRAHSHDEAIEPGWVEKRPTCKVSSRPPKYKTAICVPHRLMKANGRLPRAPGGNVYNHRRSGAYRSMEGVATRVSPIEGRYGCFFLDARLGMASKGLTTLVEALHR